MKSVYRSTGRFSLTIILVLAGLTLKGQDFKMVGEGNHNIVRLFWLPDKWPMDLVGVNIKRREKNDNWIQLNKSLIIPGAGLNRNLENVEPVDSVRTRIKDIFINYVENGKLQEIPADTYYNEVLSQPDKLSSIAMLFAVDFRLAQYCGFGFTDRTIPEGEIYEYGLFPVYEDGESKNPSAIYQWEYGTVPDTDLNISVNAERTAKKGVTLIKWEFDISEFRSKPLKGFNIYRKTPETSFKKVNDRVIWITQKTNPAFIIHKEKVDSVEVIAAAVPVTEFGLEGDRYEITLEPRSAGSGELSLKAEDNEEGILLKWEVPGSTERIMEFLIERKSHVDEPFHSIGRVSSSYSEYLDEVEAGQYFIYRVSGVGADQTIESNTIMTSYTAKSAVSPPHNLSAGIINEDDNYFVDLGWDNDAAAPEGYRIHVAYAEDQDLAWDTGIPLIAQTRYKYPIRRRRGGIYKFAVSAVGKNREVSERSNIVEVAIPTTLVPSVNLWPMSKDNNIVTLNWKYDHIIPDLAGFRIYENNELIVNENELGPQARSWESSELEPGEYSYEVTAVTSFDIESRKSQIIRFEIE